MHNNSIDQVDVLHHVEKVVEATNIKMKNTSFDSLGL